MKNVDSANDPLWAEIRLKVTVLFSEPLLSSDCAVPLPGWAGSVRVCERFN